MRIPVLTALFVAHLAHVACAQLATAPATTQAATAVDEFATFGVTFKHPGAPWKRITEGGTGHIARWARQRPAGSFDAIMTLETVPLRRVTLEQIVAEMTQDTGAAPSAATDVKLGPEKAIRMTGGRKRGMAMEGLAARHGDYAYVIAAFADSVELLPRDAMTALARDMDFVPFAEPSEYPVLRGEKFPVFKRIQMEPLATMRPNPGPSEPGRMSIGTYNYRAGRPEFIADIHLVPNRTGTTLEQMQALFPGKLNPAHNAKWTRLGVLPPITVSDTFACAFQGQKMKARVALVLLPPANDIIVVH